MTREEHLVFCKKCTNRKLDMQQGMLCTLTDRVADFDPTCISYTHDETVKERVPEDQEEIIPALPEAVVENLRKEQNFPAAIISGAIVGFICAIIWAAVSISTGYQIGWLAVAIGFAVGFSMGILGKGVDPKFGYAGGLIALLSCVLGNFFTVLGMIANYEGLGYFETLLMFNYGETFSIMAEAFSPMDILFYGIAIFEGYKYSFRKVTDEDIQRVS
ncbi:hypothetical protein H0I23_03100 [Cellulophaga sp. HaHaR_3_176]|uniref:hypothetical protein n=1 Tax=Cellulophaga sp. HaHaR_3_176 TaxID=1942464 RepID=UPI001C1FDCDD|nr:hypothetical protein [Cellulophaga sp. HaHaR_3_176]QWX84648.1 hypothetical protein H0I23_03100 [Cellulophaga sp. HaHaR_3_176]